MFGTALNVMWCKFMKSLFLITQTATHFERMMLSDNARNYRKFADEAMHDKEQGVPGLFPQVAMALGAMHQCRRGVF
jgi:hypothetical protein